MQQSINKIGKNDKMRNNNKEHGKKQKIGKIQQLIKQPKNDSDDDCESESAENFLFGGSPPERIFRDGSHIYYTSSVTLDSINKLAKMINTVNNDYDKEAKNVKYGKYTAKPIYLHIHSFGGSLFDGFRAMNMIENSKYPIHTIVEGVACSAGSMMYLGGKKRYMTNNSYLLIHQLSSGASGKFEELKDDFVNNEKLMRDIINIYVTKSKNSISQTELEDILKRDLFWDVETCSKYNLVDSIYNGTK